MTPDGTSAMRGLLGAGVGAAATWLARMRPSSVFLLSAIPTLSEPVESIQFTLSVPLASSIGGANRTRMLGSAMDALRHNQESHVR